MQSNEPPGTSTRPDHSSSEQQSDSSSDFLSQVLSNDSPPNLILRVSRVLARILLGSATALLMIAMVMFALAAWVTLWPFRRSQSAQFRLALQVAADIAALYQARQATRR